MTIKFALKFEGLKRSRMHLNSVIVSIVVPDFDEMIKSVSSNLTLSQTLSKLKASTLSRK